MQNRDVRNTGHASEVGGPTGPVQRLWAHELPGLADPIVLDGTVYAQSESGTCVALDLRSGEKRWSNEVGEGELHGRFSIAASTETVFAYNDDLYALDRATGERRWKRNVGGRAKVLVDDGTVFVMHSDGVRVMDATSGEQTAHARRDIEAGPVVDACVAGGRIYVTGDGLVQGFDAENGEELWSVERSTDDDISGIIGGVSTADGAVYAAAESAQRLLRLDGETGEVAWERELKCLESPAIRDGTLYVSSVERGLLAIDAESGQSRSGWTVDLDREPFAAPSVTTDSVVFVVGRYFDQRLIAFDPESGAEQWAIETEDKMGSIAVTEDVLVLPGEQMGAVVALATDRS